MPRHIVDFSIYLETDVVSDPPGYAPKIQYFTHQNTFGQIAPFFPGLRQDDLTDGEGWAIERVEVRRERRRDADLEGHKAGRDIGYCHIEKLHNLEALPASGFYIS